MKRPTRVTEKVGGRRSRAGEKTDEGGEKGRGSSDTSRGDDRRGWAKRAGVVGHVLVKCPTRMVKKGGDRRTQAGEVTDEDGGKGGGSSDTSSGDDRRGWLKRQGSSVTSLGDVRRGSPQRTGRRYFGIIRWRGESSVQKKMAYCVKQHTILCFSGAIAVR